MVEIQGFPVNQSSWRRAFRDTLKAQQSPRFTWGGQAVVATALGAFATAIAKQDAPVAEVVARAVIGGIIGLASTVILIFLLQWVFLVPRKQRNEARRKVIELEAEKDESKLVDIFFKTTSVGLPLNRLDDGRYQASKVGVGVNGAVLANRGDLTTVDRVTASPQIRFTQANKLGWRTTDAISIVPSSGPPASAGQRDFTWDTSNPQQWVLNGLPLVMARDEVLQLPMMFVSIVDGDEVGEYFENGATCSLIIGLAIRTDKGSPQLPDQVVDMPRNDIRDA